MFISLTGTPGTGKTSVAGLLKAKGFTVIDIQRLAIDENITEGMDSERDSVILDPARLDQLVLERFDKKNNIIFEGHLSHLLSCMDKVIILRCRPDELRTRLATKGWRKEKVSENLEAEIIDVILCEAVDEHGKDHVFEIDTTGKSVTIISEAISDLISDGFSNNEYYKVGSIDWSEFLSDEFLGGEKKNGP